jgi:hypothetical protein
LSNQRENVDRELGLECVPKSKKKKNKKKKKIMPPPTSKNLKF